MLMIYKLNRRDTQFTPKVAAGPLISHSLGARRLPSQIAASRELVTRSCR